MSKKKKPAWQRSAKHNDERITHAAEEGLPYLYRYLRFTLEKPKPTWDSGPEMLKDILAIRRVRCSNPRNFNDPWDCKPCVHPDLLNDPAARRIMAESLISTQNGGPKFDMTDLRLLSDPAFLKKNMTAFDNSMPEFIAGRWGIVCLSATPRSTLMWSHYSEHHRGICLEFEATGTLFGAALKIVYRTEYPKMLLGGNYGTHMLTVKAKEWSEEKEYRLVCPLSEDVTQSKESPLVMNDGFLSIGDCLNAVIVGCEMETEAFQAIRILLRDHSSDIRLKRAVRVPHNFLLTVEDVVDD